MAFRSRNRKTVSRVLFAESCRRRNSPKDKVSGHASMAPPAIPRTTCSQAHSDSLLFCVRINSNFSNARPRPCRAEGQGIHGGSIMVIQRSFWLSRASTGNSRLSSPQPAVSLTSSVTAPIGQPLPGKASSSALWPVLSVCIRCEICLPRHSSGWESMGLDTVRGIGTQLPRSGRTIPTPRPSMTSSCRRRSI